MNTNLPSQQGSLPEPDAHLMARHLRLPLRVLLVVSLAATLMLLLFYPSVAYLAAIPIPVLILASAWINEVERRSRLSVLRHQGQDHIDKQEVEADVEASGLAMGLKVAGALALGTFIVAASIFDLQSLGIGAAALLMLAILIQLPYLGLYVTEAEREELEKVRPQTHSRRPAPPASPASGAQKATH